MLHRAKLALRVVLPLLLAVCLTASPVLAQSASGWVDNDGRSIDRTSTNQGEIQPSLPTLKSDGQVAANTLLSGILFQPYTAIAMPGARANAVGVGDFNSDGLNDVAVTDDTNGTGLWIFLQNRDGSLASPVLYATGSRPESLAVGDLNHDGRTDLATANFGSNTIGVFLQNAGGTLDPQLTYPTSTGPDAMAIADLNNDGWDDIAVSHWNAPVLGIFYQQSDGKLASMTGIAAPQAGYDDIDTGDFNHDGLTDIVKMNGQGYDNPNLSVYLQQPGGGFSAPVPYDLGAINSSGVAAGDVTGDGLDDIGLVYGGNSPSSALAIYAQSGSGSLSLQTTYASYDIPEPVEIVDVNLDGRKDLLTVHGGWYALGVYLQNTDGSLANEQLFTLPYASHYGPQGLDIGDINGDGSPDVVIGDYNSGLVILYSAGIVQPIVGLTASSDSPTQLGRATQLSAGITSGSNVSYLWDFGDGKTGTGISVLHTYGQVGQYTATVTASNETGSFQASTLVRIVDVPITGLTINAQNPVRVSTPATLSAAITAGTNVTYHWEFGDGASADGASVSHTYRKPGNYPVKVTAVNSVGSAVQTMTLRVVKR